MTDAQSTTPAGQAAPNLDQQIEQLLKVLTSQDPAAKGDEFQPWLLSFLQELTGSPSILLITVQPGQPALAERMLFSNDQQHLQRLDPVYLEESILQACLEAARDPAPGHEPNSNLLTAIRHLTPDLNLRNAWISLLRTGEQKPGLLLICDPSDDLGLQTRQLVNLAAVSLASSIQKNRLIQQFQITIADLEASRWEVLNSRNTLRTLFDNIPISIYIVNKDYSIAAINKHRASQLDVSIPRIVGKKCYKVLFNLDGICPGCQINHSLLEGKNSSRQKLVWESDQDQQIELEISSYPVFNEDRIIMQAIMVEDDITEKRRLEESLIQNEKMAAIGQLAAGMAHEINNPLTAIIANAQLILRASASNIDIRESADLIEQAGQRASQTIQELLRFSRQDSYTFTRTDLNQSIEKVIALLQHELVKIQAKIDLDLQPGMPPINASEDHLQSVWVNLIINALDAAANQPLEIKVTTRYADGEFLILVADNGQGIPQDRISRIFTPFFTTKAPGRGTGLGLSICHRIVKNHGGEIRVESRVGHGTRFVIVLPEHYP